MRRVKPHDFSDGVAERRIVLPPIHRFIIDGGRFNVVDDQRKLAFSGSVRLRERLSQKSQVSRPPKGVLNHEPFSP